MGLIDRDTSLTDVMNTPRRKVTLNPRLCSFCRQNGVAPGSDFCGESCRTNYQIKKTEDSKILSQYQPRGNE